MPEPPPASSWAAPPEFYIDENVAGRTVQRFITRLGYTVHTPVQVFGRVRLRERVNDEDWLPIIGQHGWAVFGRDYHIMEREYELKAYLAAKVHMFLLPGEAKREEIISLLSRNLSEICTATAGRRPNVYWLTPQGLHDYERRRSARERRRRLRR